MEIHEISAQLQKHEELLKHCELRIWLIIILWGLVFLCIFMIGKKIDQIREAINGMGLWDKWL